MKTLSIVEKNIISIVGIAVTGVTIKDAHPTRAESESGTITLPFVVVEHSITAGHPFELGTTDEDTEFNYTITVYGNSKAQRDAMLTDVYDYLRDNCPFTFYNVKKDAAKKVILDTGTVFASVFTSSISYRSIPPLSDHVLDRYRGEVIATFSMIL